MSSLLSNSSQDLDDCYLLLQRFLCTLSCDGEDFMFLWWDTLWGMLTINSLVIMLNIGLATYRMAELHIGCVMLCVYHVFGEEGAQGCGGDIICNFQSFLFLSYPNRPTVNLMWLFSLFHIQNYVIIMSFSFSYLSSMY